MNPNHVPQSTLALANEHWRTEARPVFEATPCLTPLLPVIDALGRSFVDDQSDPRAEVRERVAVAARHTARLDDLARGLDALLHGFARIEPDPAQRAKIEAARRILFPSGMAFVTRGASDKAGEGMLMIGRLDAEQRALLGTLRFGDQTALDFLERTFIGECEALADAQAARLAAQARVSHRTRGFNLATRRRFLRLDATLRNLLLLNEVDPAVSRAVLGAVDRLFADAERRARARRAANGRTDEIGRAHV